MSSMVLCAIADDDCLDEVVATARVLGATRRLQPVFVYVGRSPNVALSGVGGAAVATQVRETPAEEATEVGAALIEAVDLWDDPTIHATGDPATELARLGWEYDAAVIVAGTHGRGVVAGALHGSVSQGLVRSSTRPVLLVRHGVIPALDGPIVCAVDLAGDHHPTTAEHAAGLAANTERPLVLAHVLPAQLAAAVGGPVLAPMPLEPRAWERDAAEEALHGLAASLPVDDVECVVLDPAPIAARLDDFARSRDADLLVVGSRGCGRLRSALERSVSHELLRNATRPLVIVPPDAGDVDSED